MSEPFSNSRPVEFDDAPASTSAFVPVLILGLVVMMWFAFQATQFRNEQTALRDALATQEKQFQESKKLRDSLEALMHGTTQLADGGNPNARLIIDELKKRGVTYSPTTPAATDAAPPAK